MIRSPFISVRTALFPVGGLGTRFLPATKAVPKEMLPVLGKPLIQYAVEEARNAGITRFIFVTGKGKDAIENHFDRAFQYEHILKERDKKEALSKLSIDGLETSSVVYIRQGEPLGLGHAVWCARHLLNEPFAVLLADDLVLSPQPEIGLLMKKHKQHGGQWASVQEVSLNDTQKYGILDIASKTPDVIAAKGIVEKPQPENAPSRTAVLGRYVLDPAVFDMLDQAVKNTSGHQKEVQLTDTLCDLIPQKPLYGSPLQGRRFDCGNKRGMFEAMLAVAEEDAELAPLFKRLQQKMAL